VGWDRGTIWALTPLRGMESMHVIGVRVHVMPNIQVVMLPTRCLMLPTCEWGPCTCNDPLRDRGPCTYNG
jgi:hypothetical protein